MKGLEEVTLADITWNKEIVKDLEDYMSMVFVDIPDILFWGNRGCGKSYLARALLNTLKNRGYSTDYIFEPLSPDLLIGDSLSNILANRISGLPKPAFVLLDEFSGIVKKEDYDFNIGGARYRDVRLILVSTSLITLKNSDKTYYKSYKLKDVTK